MKRTLTLLFAAALAFTGAGAKPRLHYEIVITPHASLEFVKAVWTQYTDGGLEARAVVTGNACPQLFLDLKPVEMTVRAAANDDFPTICAAAIPPGTKQAALAFRQYATATPPADAGMPALWVWERQSRYAVVPLALPVADPQRILVIGDGGCRVKGGTVQDCRDPNAWPFAKIAAAAAKLRPDLIVHVGDYPSREQPCPVGNAVCQGQPFGDNWTVWNADLFEPMAPLLAVAPVVFARGNHEECRRTGPGFMRLLSAFPFDETCPIHQKPFAVRFDHLTLTVLDDAAADERSADPALVEAFRGELAALDDAPQPNWLILHRPIFGAMSGPLGVKVGGNRSLIEALPANGLKAALMLSGHIHAFEALNYEGGVPPQLIAGLGGDVLTDVPDDPAGTVFQGHSGAEIVSGDTASEHGFVLLTKMGNAWRVERFDADGNLRQTCRFEAGRLACPHP